MTYFEFIIHILFFNIIFIFIFFSLLFTIISKNPVSAILFLISFFFSVSILLIYCGADYLGILFLLLYAGAISIIFLFVVMFLDIKDLFLRREKFSYIIFFLFFMFFCIMFFNLILSSVYINDLFIERIVYTDWLKIFSSKSNIESLGIILYENYVFQFLIIGLFLFLIMVFIISLLINYNKVSKKQNLMLQMKKKQIELYNKNA